MTRVRIVGAVVLVLLGVGLVIRVTDRAGEPPRNPARPTLAMRAEGTRPVIESVDLRNGNLHVEIPIRATRHKKAAPRSGH